MLTKILEPTKRKNSRPYIEESAKPDSSSSTSSPNQQLIFEAAQRIPNQTHPSPRLKASMRTPLLMPPPASLSSRIKHQVSIHQHHARTWATVNRQTLQLLIRLLIFAAKVASIMKPCGPIATKETIWWPLIGLAALELALGARLQWKVSFLFAIIHIFVLIWLLKLGGGGLCVIEPHLGRAQDDWRHS
jgi:hypothetical protein